MGNEEMRAGKTMNVFFFIRVTFSGKKIVAHVVVKNCYNLWSLVVSEYIKLRG
jgi:hypothetical protein